MPAANWVWTPGTLKTTSFRAESPTLRDSIRVGDPIRFSLRGTVADDAAVVAIERW